MQKSNEAYRERDSGPSGRGGKLTGNGEGGRSHLFAGFIMRRAADALF